MSNQNQHKPGYKHTPLGWIPDDWQFGKLSDILPDKNSVKTGPFGSTLIKEFYTNSGYKIYGQEHVIAGSLKLGDYYIDEVRFKQLKQFEIAKNDLLISLVGTLGKVLVVEGEFEKGIINPRLLRIRLSCNKFLPSYFAYYLQSFPVQNQLQQMSTGGTMDIINAGTIKSLKLIVPSFKEQYAINEILKNWDDIVTKTQQLIAQLQQRNKGLMQQLLKPKDDWKEYRIGDLLKEVKRPVTWNDDELYHLISVRRRSGGAFFRESLYGKQILTKQLFTTEEGDFLISKMQIVHGASAVVPTEFAGMKISGSYIAVHAKDDNIMDINFFNWLSKTPWFYKLTYISSYGVHIEKMTFDFDDFKRRKMMLPPTIEEQHKIVQILQTASDEVSIYQQKLAALQQQKKGLMQKLLTGEVRVK